MNNETTTAVTAEAVTAAATQAAASQKIAAKSIAEANVQETPERSSWIKVISTSLLASLIVAVVILAFTWPTKTMEAKNLPVSITGPEVTVSEFEQSLKDRGIETFELKQATSREDAENQIKQRETYGAIVFTEGAAPEVLTAPAANAAATQMLNGVATQLNAQIQHQALAAKTQALTQAVQAGGEQGAQAAAQLEQMKAQAEKASAMAVKITVVVPLNDVDTSGTGIAVTVFPLVIGGILGGSFSALRVNGTWRRFATATLYAVIGGAVTALILSTWFGIIPGDFATLWAAFGATYLATASFMIGLGSLFVPPRWPGPGCCRHHVHRQPDFGCKHAERIPARCVGADWSDDGAGCILDPAAFDCVLPGGCNERPVAGARLLDCLRPSRRRDRLDSQGAPRRNGGGITTAGWTAGTT